MATRAINTAKVTGRRELHFETLDGILSDVKRRAVAREIKTLGIGTTGQLPGPDRMTLHH